METMAEALNVSTEIAEKLQCKEGDERQRITNVGQIQLLMPPITTIFTVRWAQPQNTPEWIGRDDVHR